MHTIRSLCNIFQWGVMSALKFIPAAFIMKLENREYVLISNSVLILGRVILEKAMLYHLQLDLEIVAHSGLRWKVRITGRWFIQNSRVWYTLQFLTMFHWWLIRIWSISFLVQWSLEHDKWWMSGLWNYDPEIFLIGFQHRNQCFIIESNVLPY